MTKMDTRKTVLATLLAALAATPLAVAPLQVQAQAQAQHVYTQAEIDQMLAPIALYPDALLSQILMAATYPIEVVEAARWSRANPGLQGDVAVRAVENEDWDPSVKSLVAFPQILQRMDEKLEWTRSLGDAFLAQETQVMDQVQQLRRRAEANGYLRSDEQIRVVREGPVIVVQPARPDYFYVPYYDPLEVYGAWWWPAYRPVAWSPWPGYVRPYYRPGISVGFWWGRPIGLSLGFFFGDFDWGRRQVRVAHTNTYYYREPAYVNRSFAAGDGRWQHDPHHRREVAYRNAEVRQRFANVPVERRTAPRDERRAERVQAQPQVATPPQRTERRDDRRDDRRVDRREDRRDDGRADRREERRDEGRVDRREDRRDDRRTERQAAPAAQAQPQPAAQPRAERRDDGRAERQAAMEAQRQARQQAQQQQARQAQESQHQAQRQAQESQRQAQQQAQRQAQESQRHAQQQARQEQRAAAPAVQQPRAERQERHEERREQRKDHDKS